jgi:hypothetical protein
MNAVILMLRESFIRQITQRESLRELPRVAFPVCSAHRVCGSASQKREKTK